MTTRKAGVPRTLSPSAQGRVLFAFFLQPFIAGLITFALFPVIDYTGRGFNDGQPADVMDAAASVGAGAALAAVFVVAFAAAPLFIWMVRRGEITLRHALLAGFTLGNLPGVLITLSLIVNPNAAAPGDFPALAVVRAITIPGFIGAACAAVFWLMTRDKINES